MSCIWRTNEHNESSAVFCLDRIHNEVLLSIVKGGGGYICFLLFLQALIPKININIMIFGGKFVKVISINIGHIFSKDGGNWSQILCPASFITSPTMFGPLTSHIHISITYIFRFHTFFSFIFHLSFFFQIFHFESFICLFLSHFYSLYLHPYQLLNEVLLPVF